MSLEPHLGLKNLVLPPGVLLLLALVGLLLIRRGVGRAMVALSIGLLWLLSLPVIADRLLCSQETLPPLTPAAIRDYRPQAVVLLGGGVYRGKTEYGGDTVGRGLISRLRYAAWLAKRYQLPVIPTGGAERGLIPEAHLARTVLEEEFGVPVTLLEDRSRTTWENAQFIREVLQESEIERVLLVTDAWHMPRAHEVFRKLGVDALAAPTLFTCPGSRVTVRDWIPNAESLWRSRMALHEMLGRIWYALRG